MIVSSFVIQPYTVWNVIPIFKDKANWSHDTAQPMRRHAWVCQKINQLIKNFSKWQTEADRALLFHFPFNISL